MSKRRVLLRCVVVGALVMSAVALGGSASAAPPANDDIGGAVVINEPLPFSSTQSTLEATTSADETALQSFCGSPAFEHAVWFTATPTQDEIVAVDVSASDYGAGILILTGTPGNLSPVNCQPSRIAGPATGGQTYFVVVFGDGTTPATSGNLVLNVATTALVDVNLVSVTEPLTFNLALQGATCTPGTFAVASADANGTTVTPLSVTEDPTNANIASMVLPSDSPPGFLTVEASCSDGTQTIRTEPGETVWAALAVTKAVQGNPPAGAAFTVRVACSGSPDADLQYPSSGGTRYVYAQPFGEDCNITEPGNGGATSVTVDADHVVIDAPVRFTATVTNTFAAPPVVRPAFTG